MHWAVKSLRPNSHFEIRDDVLIWTESNEDEAPTKSEIDAEIIRLQAEEDAQEYARNRKEEYDRLNQFELITDDKANDTTTHAAAIEAIKTKWPKDNSGPVE